MRKLTAVKILMVLGLFLCPRAFAQSSSKGNITTSGANCGVTNACIVLTLSTIPSTQPASGSIAITGTWVGTLQFEQSANNGASWVSASGWTTPGGTLSTSTTSNGTFTFTLASMTNFRVRASAFASGTAAIVINSSTATSGSAGGTGSVGSGSQFNPCYYDSVGTSTSCIGDPGFLLDPATGTTFPAPSGIGVALDITGDANTSNIQNWRLTGGGIGAWVDNLGGFHGTSGDFGAGLGQGCLRLYDPTGLLYVNHCGPNANLAANYEVDDPAVPSAGFLYFDGFQTTSWSPAPASASNGLSSGGQVICSTATLVCTISAATFTINGVQYSSPQTDVTLVADGSNPRIDTFYVGCTLSGGVCDGTNVGIANFIPGTPAGSPSQPSIDPTIELQVGFVTIATSGTSASVTNEVIYEDDAGPAAEWTVTATGAGINVAGTTGCYAASAKCIIGTAVTAGQLFKGVRGSGTVIPSSFNVLGFQVKSGGTWPKNKCLNIAFYNGTTLVGNAVSFCNGSFAFNSTQTSTYQQIAIAASLFNATTAVDTVIFTATGGGAAFSWTVDHIILQSGITGPPETGSGVTSIAATSPITTTAATGAVTLSLSGGAGQVPNGATGAFTATPSLGTDNSVGGTVQLATAASNAHTIIASGATSSYTFTTPTTGGTSGYVLSTNGSGTTSWIAVSAASQGPFPLNNCTPDASGNVFYTVNGLTNWNQAGWQFLNSLASDTKIYCTVVMPHVLPSGTAKIVLANISANDGTAGHTMTFKTCDIIPSTTMDVGSITCQSTQNFTTTSTAYAPSTLTFGITSTAATDAQLIVVIDATTASSMANNVTIGSLYLEWQ